MFPNARLMVVAILAAIAGIGCGLGLFATFRVNHEPLSRFAEGSPPLQLAFDNVALGSDARVPLETRLPFGTAGKVSYVPVIVPTPAPAAEPAGADAAPAGSAVQETAAADAAADQSNTASLAAAAEPPGRSSATPEAIAMAPGQQQATPAQDQRPADPAATTPGVEQAAAIATAADDRQPTSQPTKLEETKTAKPATAARPAAQARRPAKIVRIRRTVTTTAAQASYQYSQPAYSRSAYSQPTYSQPTYGWTSGTAQASQPVKRVVAKRHRAPAKPAPAVQSTPAATTAGLSNSQ